MLSEIQSYLAESLVEMPQPVVPEVPPTARAPHSGSGGMKVDLVSLHLYHLLNIPSTAAQLKRRIRDLQKNLQCSRGEVNSLRDMAESVGHSKSFRVQQQVQVNTKNLEDEFRANERASASIGILQVVLAGSLAFDIIDRAHGLYLGIAAEIEWCEWPLPAPPPPPPPPSYVGMHYAGLLLPRGGKLWVSTLRYGCTGDHVARTPAVSRSADLRKSPVYDTPGLLFVVNMLWWIILGVFIQWVMRILGRRQSQGILAVRYRMVPPCITSLGLAAAICWTLPRCCCHLLRPASVLLPSAVPRLGAAAICCAPPRCCCHLLRPASVLLPSGVTPGGLRRGLILPILQVNEKIDIDRFLDYISTKKVVTEDVDTDALSCTKKFVWTERAAKHWRGGPPKIEIVVDMEFQFLLKCFIQVGEHEEGRGVGERSVDPSDGICGARAAQQPL
ncbi:hypothetical protein CYMTET_23650 [Cymbomonas tetramitiformis]|uniref:Uncharacterized protein n=1 Tax=Cymbomonas tetramitiformis TaxID=36881 RepID=A0AAE0FYW0_9CHLO|nr:hypothetical protein CYMTET_23650 [Cymbomonas tetramitiformis]